MNFNSRPHGGRLLRRMSFPFPEQFQLTPSRRATPLCIFLSHQSYISTHALTEGDRLSIAFSLFCIFIHFNSRPHGGRQISRQHPSVWWIFQLTPSRRATKSFILLIISFCISTHALTEGDAMMHNCKQRSVCISTHALTEGDLKAAE